jgi:hypothetical protein
MARKRGRPLSGVCDGATINRRRLETRERVRRLRIQRKGLAAVRPQPPTEQLQQGEQIVDLASIVEAESPRARLAADQCMEEVALTSNANNSRLARV